MKEAPVRSESVIVRVALICAILAIVPCAGAGEPTEAAVAALPSCPASYSVSDWLISVPGQRAGVGVLRDSRALRHGDDGRGHAAWPGAAGGRHQGEGARGAPRHGRS